MRFTHHSIRTKTTLRPSALSEIPNRCLKKSSCASTREQLWLKLLSVSVCLFHACQEPARSAQSHHRWTYSVFELSQSRMSGNRSTVLSSLTGCLCTSVNPSHMSVKLKDSTIKLSNTIKLSTKSILVNG